jgi:protein deglycase
LEDVQDNEFDLVAIPGGLKNAQTLAECELLIKILKRQKAAGKWYAAICASPALVFQRHGLLDNEIGTCHPSLADKLENKTQIDNRVVVSNKCITSRGPGTSCEFGLELVRALFGNDKPKSLQDGMLIKA